MAKLKRNLPKIETDNFQINSNLKSWKNQNPNQFWREQENSIAVFKKDIPNRISKLEALSNRKSKNFRRDDSNFKETETETNYFHCLRLVKLSSKIRTEAVNPLEVKGEFIELMQNYLDSVRRLGNFCAKCSLPIKVKTHRLLDCEKETLAEKKERRIFRKSYSFTEYFSEQNVLVKTKKGNGFVKVNAEKRKFSRKFETENGLCYYRPEGELTKIAKMFGCFVILLVENNEVASMKDIAKFKSIKFINVKHMQDVVYRTCECLKKTA